MDERFCCAFQLTSDEFNQNRRSAFGINRIRLIEELYARYSPATIGHKAVGWNVICGAPHNRLQQCL